jgi:hypothetical protein
MDCGNRALQIVQRSIIKPPGALHLHSLTQNHCGGVNCFLLFSVPPKTRPAFSNLLEEKLKVISGN